jgi:glycosyltransferase involved in cell wall biosynthesis
MKIVQLVTQMESGGAQRVAMLLNQALIDRGYDAEVWFFYLKRPTYSGFPGVRVLFGHQPSGLDYFKIAIKLREMLVSHQPDVFITHTHYANVIGQLIARFSGIEKRIAVQHNPVQTYPQLAKWADSIIGFTDIYSTNIAVSHVVIDSVFEYSNQYKSRLKQIYNGIPQLAPIPLGQTVRADWNLPENVPLLINVGRLARQKNHVTLIESLQYLPNAHLLLIGDGELRSDLEAQIVALQLEARVHIFGELKSEDVLDLMAIADVFVFPSLYEAMPMALIEAMGSGLPIVGGDIPAMQEVLGDAGLIVPSENAVEIANAVRRVLDSTELAARLKQSSIERAALFSVTKMVESYEQLFN